MAHGIEVVGVHAAQGGEPKKADNEEGQLLKKKILSKLDTCLCEVAGLNVSKRTVPLEYFDHPIKYFIVIYEL